MRRSFDLLICIRCHEHSAYIEDTIDSVLAHTQRKTTSVMCAVDGRPDIALHLQRKLPGAIYCSAKSWGWGPGLYGLLAESIQWARRRWKFSHFLSIDYDTLFISHRADDLLLELITDPAIGLIGSYRLRNAYWKTVYTRDLPKLSAKLGPIPRTYCPGEGVQGGCMLLTSAFLHRLKERKMLKPPFKNVRKITAMADDHLIPLFCRMCGLEILNIPEGVRVQWRLYGFFPWKLEKKGIRIIHPVKGKKQNVEFEVRNYYRVQRGQHPLRELPSRGRSGP